MSEHRILVKLIRAWNEYRADCSCGWTGSYFQIQLAAVEEGRQHVASEADRLTSEV